MLTVILTLASLIKISSGSPSIWPEFDPFDYGESRFVYGSRLNRNSKSDNSMSSSSASSALSTNQLAVSATYSEPIIIISGESGNNNDNSGNRQSYHQHPFYFPHLKSYQNSYEEQENQQDDSNEQKTKIDQPIAAYVPTVYVIDSDSNGENNYQINQQQDQNNYQVNQQQDQNKDQDIGVMFVPSKQPEHFTIINGNENDDGAKDELIEKSHSQFYQEPEIVEAIRTDDAQFKESTEDSISDPSQKMKLTLLFLGYEKH